MKHFTPGPWVVGPRNGHMALSIDAGPRTVASAYLSRTDSRNNYDTEHLRPENAEALANARLIAVAPDLIESLKEIARMATQDIHTDFAGEILLLIEKEARAAVEKAVGR